MCKLSKTRKTSWIQPVLILLGVFLLCAALALLASCSSNPTQSQMPSLRPIVKCNEHAKREPLPVWPVAVPNRAGTTDEQYIHALEEKVSADAEWAAEVAGVTQRNTIKSNATANCLDTLRAAGTIL